MSKPTPPAPPVTITALAIKLRASQPRDAKLSKERKQFNKLVKDIAALRQWREVVPTLHDRVTTEIKPLATRLPEHRVQLVMLLSRAIDGKQLGKRQKTKAMEVLR